MVTARCWKASATNFSALENPVLSIGRSRSQHTSMLWLFPGNCSESAFVGHACSPRQGSEPSFTWNWAWELSQRNGVWVIAHPHDRIGVEKFLADHPNANLKFHWVTV